MVLPGPFIIIGILLSTLAYWFQQQGGMWRIAHYGVYVCTCLVIVAQLSGSTAVLIDEASGNNLHGYSYNTLISFEDALNQLNVTEALFKGPKRPDPVKGSFIKAVEQAIELQQEYVNLSSCAIPSDPRAYQPSTSYNPYV